MRKNDDTPIFRQTHSRGFWEPLDDFDLVMFRHLDKPTTDAPFEAFLLNLVAVPSVLASKTSPSHDPRWTVIGSMKRHEIFMDVCSEVTPDTHPFCIFSASKYWWPSNEQEKPWLSHRSSIGADGGSSPRSELTVARQKWQLHSLAGSEWS